jgi:DNA mismatch repair protein MutS
LDKTLLTEINLDQITPMMQQYVRVKKQWMDCILFFRLGDFYEMFFDDAIAASKELELALTGRDCGLPQRAPMCGIPYHASDSYVAKLVNRGYKVAICEQVEDVSVAKGIVKREVIKVITPGTITDITELDEKSNNFMMAIYKMSNCYGIAFTDITTGTLLAADILTGNTTGKLIDEIAKKMPSEIICNKFMNESDEMRLIGERFHPMVTVSDHSCFSQDQFVSLFPTTDPKNKLWIHAVSALMEYIIRTQSSLPEHLKNISIYSVEEFMHLDMVARTNLEITQTMKDKSRKGSLLWVIDKTHTAMGGRLLKQWIEQPLLNKSDIIDRQDAVEEIKEKFLLRQELMEILSSMYDIERISGKIALKTVNARDLISLRNSLYKLPSIKKILTEFRCPLWRQIHEGLDCVEDIAELIDRAIMEEPPISIKEGNIIKPGFNDELMRLKDASTNGKKWILDYEASERERTKIKNLKIKFTNNFGFLIEISNSNKNIIPEDYVRRQTLVGGERYITEELKNKEESILGAEQKLLALEYTLFCEIRDTIHQSSERLFKDAKIISQMDALASLGEVSDRNRYCRPVIDQSDLIDIEDGRHPVVEKTIGEGEFVPNSVSMDESNQRIHLITGPNMGGKSTYMRQIAHIVILAQIGCFVPAQSAHIGLVDKIFTRIGALDDLSTGQSTFMVEMNEVSYILQNATSKSLLILDEVGRGTSTYDGLSIAWAVIEYIGSKNKLGCKTLFATHYHELIGLEETVEGMINVHVEADEKNGDIVFLHKIKRGGCDESYGIEVAKLAGLPNDIIIRAKEILTVLEKDQTKDQLRIKKNLKVMEGQIDIFTSSGVIKIEDSILEELKTLDVQKMTPLEAMNLLYTLSERAKSQ